jgi:hypothetical protein
MPLKTRANGFGRNCPDIPTPGDPNCPQCNDGQLEFCVRICWNDDCPLDWDLWVREREGLDSGTAWASYLNLGPVGETRIELNNSEEKSANCDFCNDIVPPCGLSEPANGYAGEMTCLCLDGGMTFPKVFDIVVNHYGSDLIACPFVLGALCVQYFCNSVPILETTVDGETNGSGLADAGNYGLSPHRQPAIRFTDACCENCEEAGTSKCWVITAERSDGTLFVNRGPGRSPNRFVIPDDADIKSCILFEDGMLVPRSAYDIIHESVARRASMEMADYGTRGTRMRSKSPFRQDPKKPCKGCREPKKRSIF